MRKLLLILNLLVVLVFPACDNDDPVQEQVPELITEVTLQFTTDNGSTVISVTGTDPDGEGPLGIQNNTPIELTSAKTYSLKVLLRNHLAGTDISAEVAGEGTDHMFFFGFSEGMFSDPEGDGNIDKRADKVNYVGPDATDANGLPLGLTTEWTTSSAVISGQIRIMLKHQPGLKTATSGSDVGETDLDVFFDVIVR